MAQTMQQIVVTENEEKIIFKDLDEMEKAKSYGMDSGVFPNFMLKKPEPVKKDLEFTVHGLGVKGNLRRTEIYEDR